MKDYIPGLLETGGKMQMLFSLLEESLAVGDKMLVFRYATYLCLYSRYAHNDLVCQHYYPVRQQLAVLRTSVIFGRIICVLTISIAVVSIHYIRHNAL